MTLTSLLTSLVVVATPGTGALFTVAAGLVAAAGCTLGIVPHLAAAITGAGASALAHLLGLSAAFMLMTFALLAVHGVLAARVRTRLLDRPRVVVGLRQVFAASFVALGARLATTSR